MRQGACSSRESQCGMARIVVTCAGGGGGFLVFTSHFSHHHRAYHHVTSKCNININKIPMRSFLFIFFDDYFKRYLY